MSTGAAAGPATAAGTGRITVEDVRTRAALREFCELPLRLHPVDRYVPVLRPQIADWWRGRGPHTRYGGRVRLLLARDASGAAVGRTCLHRDARLDARLGGPAQLFGLTEFTDDRTAGALFGHLEGEARRAGADRLFGPVHLLPNQSGGVVTSGFEHRGFTDSAWNPARYPAAYERHGFARRFPSDTWIVPDTHRLDPDAAFPFDDRRIADEGLEVHRGSRRRLAEQLPLLRAMLNESFARLGYYTPIEADELAAQTAGLAHLLDERLLLYLTRRGTPTAFLLALPDVSGFLAATGGRMGLPQQLRLLATRGRHRREAVLVVKGTVPGAQGRGYLTLLSRELHRGLREGGYTALRSTFVEHGNAASAASYRRAGGRPLHGYTFYERAVRGAGRGGVRGSG